MGGARGSVLVTAGGHQGHVANQPECKESGFPGIVNNPASLENLLHGNGCIIACCAAWAAWQERNLQLCVDCLPARWTRNPPSLFSLLLLWICHYSGSPLYQAPPKIARYPLISLFQENTLTKALSVQDGLPGGFSG